jgi:hypothetical protein
MINVSRPTDTVLNDVYADVHVDQDAAEPRAALPAAVTVVGLVFMMK